MNRGAAAEAAFRSNLRSLRTARRWSQQRVADEMIDRGHVWYQSTVAAIETGSRQIGLGEALSVAACFGVAPSHMWTGPDNTGSELRREAELMEAKLAAATALADDLRAQHEKAVIEIVREESEAQAQIGLLSERLHAVWAQIEVATPDGTP